MPLGFFGCASPAVHDPAHWPACLPKVPQHLGHWGGGVATVDNDWFVKLLGDFKLCLKHFKLVFSIVSFIKVQSGFADRHYPRVRTCHIPNLARSLVFPLVGI